MKSVRTHRRKAVVGRKPILRGRRPLVMTTAGALLLAFGSALSLATFARVDLAEAATDRAKSFMEMLSDRSPGERTQAQLTKTKHHRVLAERETPEVPKVLSAVLATPAPPPIVQAAMAPVPTPELLAFAAPPIGLPILSTPGGNVIVPGGGGGGGGCCGGGTVTPPDTPPEKPPVIPAVPEPGTWLTMLFGFGFIGWASRRTRSRAAQFATS